MTNRRKILANADEALAHIEENIENASECEKRLASGYRATRVRTEFSKPEYTPCTLIEILGVLVEESGEVLAATGKTLRFGLHGTNPDLLVDKAETNEQWLRRELRDLKRAIEIVEQALDG